MKKKILTLTAALILSSVLVAVLGGFLKYDLLRDIPGYEDAPIMSVPFRLLRDFGATFQLQSQVDRELLPDPTEPPVTEEPPTEVPTETPTEPPTEAPTEPPTEPEPLDESWFDDVLFIGDSRVVGMQTVGRLGEASYFCQVGLSVFNIDKFWCYDYHFGELNLDTLLSTHEYGKIYISLGLNECGFQLEPFRDAYGKLVDKVREKQPDVPIILVGIMTVSKAKAENDPWFSVENLKARNEVIQSYADGDKILYIDPNEWDVIQDGFLPADMTFDGIHFQVEGYKAWSQWFLESAASLNIQ